MADEAIRQPIRHPQPLPAERQIGDPVFAFARIARSTHDLKAAVEQERMYVQSVLAESFGQRHLTQRLARSGPDSPQRAERRTEIDPHIRLGAV